MQPNTLLPDFSLQDTTAHLHRLSDYRGQLVVLNFWSAECPWSERADQHLLLLQRQFAGQVSLLPVAANLNESDELISTAMYQRGLGFVLRDVACALADAWQAQTTPHAYAIDAAGILRYQGAVDDVTFRKRSPERFYVQEALMALQAQHLPSVQQTPAYGCAIVRSI